MDADIEKEQEPVPDNAALAEDYGQIVSSQEKMGLFGRVIDSFRENPQYVSSCTEA
jgi:hypothetical protein